MTGSITWVNIDDLNVDEYQRPLDDKRVRKIAREWDDDLCEPITVSKRHGTYYVVEGQTRVAAAKLKGNTRIQARLFYNWSKEREAKVFRGINRGRKATTPLDDFRAALVQGHEPEVSINRALAQRGLLIADGTGHRIPAIGTLKAMVIKYDLKTAMIGVDACSVWGLDSRSYNGAILRAVIDIIGDNQLIQFKHLVETLEKKSPERWRSDAGGFTKDGNASSLSQALRRDIVRAYNKGKGSTSRFRIK